MKKVLSLAVLFAGISLATFAQENKDVQATAKKGRHHHRVERKMEKRTPEQVASFQTDRLAKSLQFTDEQRKAVYAVQLEQAQNNAKHRQEMKASREKLAAILTPEQKEKLKAGFKQHKRKDQRILKMRRGRALAPAAKEQPVTTNTPTE